MKILTEEAFRQYVKENNLTIKSRYFDALGDISNGKMFKCNSNGFMIGTSGIVKSINEAK